ncbi:MAG: sulfonate transport system substrate-binding protein [Acidimicrobiaceae bacterium]|nr:sulfonate transport system substrate-binding protein [Acidimicrobiaceae bacterium]
MLLAACGSSSAPSAATSATTTTASSGTTGATTTAAAAPTTTSGEKVTLRLGFFPNVTHATALVGVNNGIFADSLGLNVKLETQTFNAGPAAIQAMFAGSLDATYIGPSPTINGWAQSKGQALKIISGATSGGASLVVKQGINAAADLKGKTLATPQLGGTQDVALRAWLKDQGLNTDTSGGGDVSIKPQDNGATLDAFKSGAIDGAWGPEPWATRLGLEGNGKTLVDERTLWPGGQFMTTQLIVSQKFLSDHPDVVKRLLEGQVKANDFVNANPADAQKAANDQIEKITQKRMTDATLAASWKNLSFTNDPLASALVQSATKAEAVGLLDKVDLTGIYDLDPLNEVLKAAGQTEVKGP